MRNEVVVDLGDRKEGREKEKVNDLPRTESGGPPSRCWKPPRPAPRPGKFFETFTRLFGLRYRYTHLDQTLLIRRDS